MQDDILHLVSLGKETLHNAHGSRNPEREMDRQS